MFLRNIVIFIFCVTLPLFYVEFQKIAPNLASRVAAAILFGMVWIVSIAFIGLEVWANVLSRRRRRQEIEEEFSEVVSGLGLGLKAVLPSEKAAGGWKVLAGGDLGRFPVTLAVEFGRETEEPAMDSVSITVDLPRRASVMLDVRLELEPENIPAGDCPALDFRLGEDLLCFGQPREKALGFLEQVKAIGIAGEERPWEFGALSLQKDTLQFFVVGERPREFLPDLLKRCIFAAEEAPLS